MRGMRQHKKRAGLKSAPLPYKDGIRLIKQ